MSYVWGGGTFVKCEGTTADKLDFALAHAHSFEFSSRFYKAVLQENIDIKSGKCGFIHSATIHQGDELFSVEQSRVKQCAFMSLSAVLTAQQPTNRLVNNNI